MVSRVVNRGLQVIGGRASSTADSFAALQCVGIDNETTAFGQTDDKLDQDASGVGAEFFKDFDSTPTRSAQTITHLATIPTGSGNFVISRITIHNLAAASCTEDTVSLVSAIDGQSLSKNTDFSITFTLKHLYTSV